MRRLREPLDAEREAALEIQVRMRWALLAVALFVMLYRPGSGPVALTGIMILIAGSAAMNYAISRRLKRSRRVPTILPLAASTYDLASITLAMGLNQGFDNDAYLLYYPALLAFAVVFGTRWSTGYLLVAMPAYALTATLTHDSFSPSASDDQKKLVLRLATMTVTLLLANMIVGIERRRRLRAVAAETTRGERILALERRAREAERIAAEERRRLSQEVHDGVSQSVYMLTLGLETATALAARPEPAPGLGERLETLVRLSKQTLLDTRTLLQDLGTAVDSPQELPAMLTNQAREFSAVTGIAVDVDIEGSERALAAAAVIDLYRFSQEALANVYKHASASSARILLCYQPAALTLAVADDGRGFKHDNVPGRGHGLGNMHERANRLGGRLDVDAAEGRGTRLVLTVPLEEGEDAGDPGAGGR